MLRAHERKNRAAWDRTAAWYERRNTPTLTRGRDAQGWGNWHVPERTLHVLGDVRGLDVLELGCGAARWSVALARRGARVVGLDLSPARLDQARAEMAAARVTFPLVESSAERLPFPARRFDLVFCDWGAMTFADPYRTVPEVARVLRPGGRFAFSTASPFRSLCQSRTSDRIGPRLRYDYFGLYRLRFPDSVEFQLPYGTWIELFTRHHLIVEALWEYPAPRGVRSTYVNRTGSAWSRRWPYEMIWRVRKDADSARSLRAERRRRTTARRRPAARRTVRGRARGTSSRS